MNNVGAVTPRVDGFLAITDEEWWASLNLNLMAAVRTTRAALPRHARRGRGTIVTTCSVNAFLPDPAVIDYSAAKAALANFSKSLSKEVGPRGIRVNTVSPGPVVHGPLAGRPTASPPRSPRPRAATPTRSPQQAAGASATGRFTEPQEVADLVAVLAGERAGNVTGADFVIDGGLVQTL